MDGSTAPSGHDLAGLVHAIESDLDYFRLKRFEPRVFQLVRRGAISFSDLVGREGTPGRRPLGTSGGTSGVTSGGASRGASGGASAGDLEDRVRVLQDRLDAYILGIAAMSLPGRTLSLVVEDVRKERGDYDEFLRFTKPARGGGLHERVGRVEAELADAELVLDAVTEALVRRGEVDEGSVEARRTELSELGHRNGARIVARAWSDPVFKQRLLETGREALRDMDVPTGRLGRLAVAEDTEEVHNVVVCTLCSCYPHDVLGDPPWWYRSDEYKRRIVADPRATLADMFDLVVPPSRKIQVHDSTSDLRWMVLPRRPEGTEGWDEDRLAALVTSECLVGAAEPRPGT